MKVVLPDSSELELPDGATGLDAARAIGPKLAEQAVLVRNRKDAELYLRRAEQFVGPDDPDWFRMQDLARAVEEIEEPRRRR
jgi:hypothetical protein